MLVNNGVSVLGFSQRELSWSLQAVPTPTYGARFTR